MRKSFAITTENIDKVISDLKKKIKVANKGEKEMYIRFAIPKKYRKNPKKYYDLLYKHFGVNGFSQIKL